MNTFTNDFLLAAFSTEKRTGYNVVIRDNKGNIKILGDYSKAIAEECAEDMRNTYKNIDITVTIEKA